MKALCASLIAAFFLLPLSAAAGGVPWGEPNNTTGRFIVLSSYNNEAVFDSETGLVWEQSPDATSRNWFDAQKHCMRSTVGNRSGWRVPTIQELASLTDPSRFVRCCRLSDSLPAGHPFSNVQSNYWSATTTSLASALAYDWASSTPDLGVTPQNKANALPVWCVRGGQGVDPQ